MEIERETLLQIVFSTIAVAIFIAGAVYVSQTYMVDAKLTSQGGYALIGAIGVFLVVMVVIGVWLERQDF